MVSYDIFRQSSQLDNIFNTLSMKPHPTRFFLANTLFAVAIISSFLAHFHPRSGLLMYILLASFMIYFLLGWYLFKAYHPEGLVPVRFIMGYFYSGIFIGPLFVVADWPFTTIMLWAAVFWIALQLGFVLASRRTIPKYGYYQFLIEAFIMLAVIFLHIAA